MRHIWKLVRVAVLVALFALLLLPALALASVAKSAPTLVLPWQQVWPLIIGAIVPLFTYALNRAGSWVSEPAKALVLVVAAAAATALYTALATNVIGFNAATLQIVLTGIVAALGSHHLLWKPSGISVLLGAGTNGHKAAVAEVPPPPPPAVARSHRRKPSPPAAP